MDKIILHCDLNNFFASVECLKHPELDGHPVAVCGSSEDRHGIVLAKNEIAKKFGVKTAEVIWQAKMKCPDLVLLSPHMDEYVYYSKKVREIYTNYTDLVEPFSIDECWLDVTGSTLLFGNGEEIAYKIKEQIKRELKLTISVGVSFNKIFAKLGSDIKKPDAVTVITKDNFKKVVWKLPACDLLGVGKATYNKLIKYGINTIGDIANTNIGFLTRILGKNGEVLWNFANGNDNSNVCNKNHVNEIKSVSASTTLPKDLTNNDDIWKVMYSLCEDVSRRLLKNNLLASSIQISIKDNKLSTREIQAPLPYSTRYPKDLADAGFSLFIKNYSWKNNVRAIGIRAINLVCDNDFTQCNLLYDESKIKQHEQLESAVFKLRERYGTQSLLRASLMDKDKN